MAKRAKHTKGQTSKGKTGKGKVGKKAPAPKRGKPAAKKAAAKRTVGKPTAQKSAVNKYRGKATRMVVVTIPQHITLDLPPVLHDRLKALSEIMDMPMEAVIRQALTEFADTWEDHHRTVAALADTSDRMQLVVKDE